MCRTDRGEAKQQSLRRGRGSPFVDLEYSSHSFLDFPLLSLKDPFARLAQAFSSFDADIYSCSWGPPDDGRSFGGPSPDVLRTMLHKITFGRQGKGAIYVVAGGNGGLNDDHCGADGFALSPFTITVGAITHLDRSPAYAERCPALSVVTYSSSDVPTSFLSPKHKRLYFEGITASDKAGQCTKDHGGTSAAAPVVASSIALLLSKRTDLGWRDVNNIVIASAVPLQNKTTYDDLVSFGKLNVERLLDVGSGWKPVNAPVFISKTSREFFRQSETCLSFPFVVEESFVIEWVLVRNNLPFAVRGGVEFSIISPSGVASTLLKPRPKDTKAPRNLHADEFDSSLVGWVLTSLAFFHQPSAGKWTVLVCSDEIGKHAVSHGDMALAFVVESADIANEETQKVKFANDIFSFYYPNEGPLAPPSFLSANAEWIGTSFLLVNIFPLVLVCLIVLSVVAMLYLT